MKGIVQERVVQVEAAKLAKNAGEAKLIAVKAGNDVSGFAAPKTVSRVKNQGMEREAFQAVMKADTSKLPAYVGIELPAGFGIYRINKVAQPATVDAARRQAEQQQVANALAQQETFAYLEALKKRAKVEVVKPVVPKGDGEPDAKK